MAFALTDVTELTQVGAILLQQVCRNSFGDSDGAVFLLEIEGACLMVSFICILLHMLLNVDVDVDSLQQ